MGSTKATSTQAAGDTAPDESTTPDEAAAVADQADRGDLVELQDGRFGIVLGLDPVTLLILGHPEVHELPLRKVG